MAKIVIQAGHYPRTSGATGTGGRDGDPTEQEFNIAAARACAKRLAEVGHQGVVINADVPDGAYKGDAFVAIHCDGSTNPSARGASVGYRTDEGQSFAATFKRAYQAAGWLGGWRPDNYTAALAGYYGTKRAVAQGVRRAFIAEAGFLTNPTDEALLSLPGGPDRFARALTAAVVQTFGVPHPQEDDMPLTKNDQPTIAAGVEDAVKPGGKARDELKSLVQGAMLDGLREPDDDHPDRGSLRGTFKELLREVLNEASAAAPPAG